MSNKNQHITNLFTKWIDREATPEEKDQLMELIASSEVESDILPLLSLAWENEKTVGRLTENQKEKIIREIFSQEEPETAVRQAHRIHFLKTAWFRYAAAIIILFGTGAYIYFTQQKEKPQIAKINPIPVENDILPGNNKAILTLSNGERVQLNNATSETIKDGTLSIENNDGQLIYKHAEVVAMNIMTTPKGGQYQLTLADGTRVWLNAASSITYPTAFNGSTREVSILGEAYFEVKPNAAKPFVVKTASDVITVLGTSFNINSYNDEDAVKTSLVEGSVKVNDTNIKPGQAYKKGEVSSTNVDQDIAWKNGYFDFEGANLHTVMRQLSRWYDLKIVYEKGVPEITFFGELTRNVSLKGVLKMLEGAGVHFTLTGSTLHVKP